MKHFHSLTAPSVAQLEQKVMTPWMMPIGLLLGKDLLQKGGPSGT